MNRGTASVFELRQQYAEAADLGRAASGENVSLEVRCIDRLYLHGYWRPASAH